MLRELDPPEEAFRQVCNRAFELAHGKLDGSNTDNTKEFDAGSDVAQLRSAGVPIAVDRTDAHMHHKFAIFDGNWLLNGSYNWTRSACEHNEENLVASNDPALVGQFQRAFEQLWTSLRA